MHLPFGNNHFLCSNLGLLGLGDYNFAGGLSSGRIDRVLGLGQRLDVPGKGGGQVCLLSNGGVPHIFNAKHNKYWVN